MMFPELVEGFIIKRGASTGSADAPICIQIILKISVTAY